MGSERGDAGPTYIERIELGLERLQLRPTLLDQALAVLKVAEQLDILLGKIFDAASRERAATCSLESNRPLCDNK